jgi:hypothetical protein
MLTVDPKKCFSRERRHLACTDCASNLKQLIIGIFATLRAVAGKMPALPTND